MPFMLCYISPATILISSILQIWCMPTLFIAIMSLRTSEVGKPKVLGMKLIYSMQMTLRLYFMYANTCVLASYLQ